VTFPTTPLESTVELYIDGAWTDITSDVYHRDPITITRGRTSHSDTVDPSRCQLTLNNTSGKYSPRNPNGAYHGKIGRNTPLRVSVHAGSVALDLPEGSSGYATTPDAAALDITGDIDVRIDGTFSNWGDPNGSSSDHVELIGKLDAAPQKSWALSVRGYALYFEWSANGTDVLSASSTVPLPAGPNTRLAIRATLDVDNGAGGHTVTFYTADTMSGTWAQLGDAVTGSGTTSIAATTAALKIGDATPTDYATAQGTCYAAQVRNGIGGTIVANPDFSAQAAGTTSFADSAGRTWTLGSGATITNRKVRFVGEVSEWPVEWDVSGEDVYTQVTASGILRRLAQGQAPIKSALTRRIPTLSPLAYWPMEDGANSTVASSAMPGVADMRVSGLSFGSNDTLDGSAALPTVSAGAEIEGIVPEREITMSSWQVEFVFNLDATTTTHRTLLVIHCNGTVRTWYLSISGNSLARIQGYDDDGTVIVNDERSVGSDLSDGRWSRWQHIVRESGATASYEINWINDGGAGGTATGSYAGRIGRVVSVSSPPDGYSSELGSMAIGHVAVFSPTFVSAYDDVYLGWQGETAGARIERLCDEESIAVSVHGDRDMSQAVGPQRSAGVLDILGEAANADQGIFYESRTAASLAYRCASTLYAQRVRLALDYETAGHVAPPFKPVDDDQYVRNEITVTRTAGASAVAELSSGPLSTQAPPDGVGRYQEQREFNFATDDQPAQLAEWLLYLGTWDEARYPTVRVDLAAGPSLIDDATAVDCGDRMTVANPPPWLPPDDIDLLVQGYAEIIGLYDWEITYNCTPGGPWSHVAQVDTARADTAGSELAAAMTSSATTAYVLTTEGPEWVDSIASPSDFPFDIRCAGERMTVTACTGTEADAFGRTSSSGWGTADVGGAWAISGGTASNFAVSGGVATHTLTTVDTSRRSRLGPVLFADFDLYVSFRTSALATGDFLGAGLMARYVDGDNLYTARVACQTTQVMTLTIRKRVATVESLLVLSNVTGLVHAANTWYRMRFYGVGSALKAKVWLASDDEPEAWEVEVSDTSFSAAGQVGCRSISGAANTNVSPVVSYDDFINVSRQRMTVTRSVNGVTKAQSSGASVSLWTPSYVPYVGGAE
jgi:hypothetical protein